MLHHYHGGWGLPLIVDLSLVCIAVVYLRGFSRNRHASSRFVSVSGACSFLGGLLSIWLAVASPLRTLDHAFLTVHMIQHLLLMTIAPPLMFLGEPLLMLWNGLPQVLRAMLSPVTEQSIVQRVGNLLTQPALCWLAATGVLVAWHVPAVLTLGMQSPVWHLFQHGSFLVTGLLFWWPVMHPWPSVSAGPNWSTIVYLFLATLPCDVLSGFLVFSERVAYPVYLSTTRQSDLAVLSDQQCAGALMWTVVTVVYLVVGTVLATRLLSPNVERVEAL